MSGKTIGIVIPTLNEEDHIGLLLSDLENQTIKANEILVVDGKSSDKTREIVKKYKNVKLIKSKRGVGHQRHFGAQRLTSDILVFLDADTRVKPNFIEKIFFYFGKHNPDIACAYYLPSSKNIPIW
ncbi:MAG: glycosyltransferase, partial [Patescibacteria group bacterium]|nr:glycosyltransferase [Patescibacteria group bacterium]